MSGDRYDIQPYPKDREDRIVRLAPDLMARLGALIDAHELSGKEIIFNPEVMGLRRDAVLSEVEVGETFIGRNGREYRHGMNSGYTLGGCRCDACRSAHAVAARKGRAAKPRTARNPEIDIMAPESWRGIFYRALRASGTGLRPGQVQPRHLRHTHVSWRLDRGENVLDVMHDVGHSDLSVTSLYRVQGDRPERAPLVG